MILVLKRTAVQQAGLTKLLQEQQTKGSQSFHHWLKPEEFGSRFGVNDQDVISLTGYLTRKGLHVDKVLKNRMALVFSGDAAHVSSAFHTQLHRYGTTSRSSVNMASPIKVPASIAAHLRGIVASRKDRTDPIHLQQNRKQWFADGALD